MKIRSDRMERVLAWIMVLSCLTAGWLTARIAMVDYGRKSQAVSAITRTTPAPEEGTESRHVNTAKLSEIPLYFNGQTIYGIKAYSDSKGGFMLPLDQLVKHMGGSYRIFDPDDIIEAEVNGNKLSISLHKTTATIDGKNISLPMAAMAGKGHILVPPELFKELRGFGAATSIVKEAAFLNYSHRQQDDTRGIRLLKVIKGSALMTSADGKTILWSSPRAKDSTTVKDSILLDNDGGRALIQSGNAVFLAGKGGEVKALTGQFEGPVSWTGEEGMIYWEDIKKRTGYVYSLKDEKNIPLPEIFKMREEAMGTGAFQSGQVFLEAYLAGDGYEILTIRNKVSGATFTAIKKGGITLFAGKVEYSPDRTRMLFKKAGRYFVAGIDRYDAVDIGSYDTVRWIGGNRLLAYDHGAAKIIDAPGGVPKTWEGVLPDMLSALQTQGGGVILLGSTPGGEAILSVNGVLYVEEAERLVLQGSLPSPCGSAFSFGEEGPVVAMSEGGDSIYLVKKDGTILIGRQSLLPKKEAVMAGSATGMDSIRLSPDGKVISILQTENGALRLDLIKVDTGVFEKTVMLDIKSPEGNKNHLSVFCWMNADTVMIADDSRFLLVKVGEKAGILDCEAGSPDELVGILRGLGTEPSE